MKHLLVGVVSVVLASCNCGTPIARTFAEVSTTPQSLDFGDRTPDSSTTLSITLANSGSAPLSIQSADLQGADVAAFSLVGLPQSVVAGATTAFQVTFHPSRVGAFSARLVVLSNAANTPELSVPLVGTATAFDAGAVDAGVVDAGIDAGLDAGGVDAGFDAGLPDAGLVDAGFDAGLVDAGFDAGIVDAGFDAGFVDAGFPDAGCQLLLCGRAHAGVTCAVAGHGTVGPFDAGWATSLFNDGSGWNGLGLGRTVTFVDLDGDGRDDVCGRGLAGIDCAHNTGTTFSGFMVLTTEFSDQHGWDAGPQYFATIQFADVNGDRTPDVCGRSDAGIECAVSGAVWRSTSFNDATAWWQRAYYPSVQFADVDGDGKADACARGILGISCSLSTGTQFGPYTGWSMQFADADGWNASPASFETIQFPDVNGDGKADVCGRGVYGVVCALSDGTHFLPQSIWSTTFSDTNGWSPRSQYATIQFPDLDGDGKADVCGRGASGLQCALSNGAQFGATISTQLFNDATGWGGSTAYYSTIQFVDLDGDGRLDVCGRGVQGVHCALWSQGAFGSLFLTQALASDSAGWNDETVYPTLRFTRNGGSCRMGPRQTPAVRVGP